MLNIEWLPPHTVHKKPRVRYLRLKMCAVNGLQITVPYCCSQPQLESFLTTQRDWIEKNWLKLQARQALSPCLEKEGQLRLLALNETWTLRYHATEKTTIHILPQANHCLLIQGAVHDQVLVRKALLGWLQRHAKAFLLQQLASWSAQTGLTYQQGSVRYAKTRWGSCSSKQQISLNSRLVFLPQEFIDYVIVHELCHTVHLNHSAQFWALVQQFQANALHLRQQLRQVEAYIPVGF